MWQILTLGPEPKGMAENVLQRAQDSQEWEK